MITVDDYVARVLGAVDPLPSERMPVAEAAGRTLVRAASARLQIPPFDNSAMDGFAVHYADVVGASNDRPVILPVVSDIPAGSPQPAPLAPGTAARIMTGAPMPAGADVVVPFESTAGGLADSIVDVVVQIAPRAAGVHIRRRGEDIRIGDEVLAAHTLLGPLQIAALIAAGITEVDVSRRPRVLVISTGAELVAPGTTPEAGQIPDSNSTLLELLAASAGAEVVGTARVDDDPASLIALLDEWRGVDVVITSGGVSAGAFEPVKLALAGTVAFEKVAMQPGKPQAFGRLASGALFFGLPGNPVSVAVSFEVIARPALLALQSRAPHRPVLRLPAAEGWHTPEGRQQYLPIVVDRSSAGWRVHPATVGGSGSHLVGSLGLAQGYAIVPADVTSVHEGDVVDVMLIS